MRQMDGVRDVEKHNPKRQHQDEKKVNKVKGTNRLALNSFHRLQWSLFRAVYVQSSCIKFPPFDFMFIRRVRVFQRFEAAADFTSSLDERKTLLSLGKDLKFTVGRREKSKGLRELNFLSSN